MAIDWDAVEDAIYTLVYSALPENTPVVWAGQKSPTPDDESFITIARTAQQTMGSWVQTFQDLSRVGVGGQPGTEIEERQFTLYTLTVQVEAFGKNPIGANSPIALLASVQSRVFLPEVMEAMKQAGIVLLSANIQQLAPQLVGTEVEPRSVLELRISLADQQSSFSTYIETVEAEYQAPED